MVESSIKVYPVSSKLESLQHFRVCNEYYCESRSYMPQIFHLNREALKRRFAVYIVIARGTDNIKLYVGKTGDNREGCNPVISRCGNHFSYNKIHSQLRNKLTDHELRDYTYVFEHFEDYHANANDRRAAIDRINEIERWVNQLIRDLVADRPECELINEYEGTSYLSPSKREARLTFRTKETALLADGLVEAVRRELTSNSDSSVLT